MGVPYAEVIGDPIAHSKSPLIHKFWLEKLGLEGDYRAVRVPAEELRGYLQSRHPDPWWRGCSVTMPLKEKIRSYIDDFSLEQAETEAINCVSRIGDRLFGSNTDVAGIEEVFGLGAWRANTVTLIGGGGAARAALQVLRQLDVLEILMVVRNPEKSRALLRTFARSGCVYSFEEAGAALAGSEYVINASPLGMAGAPPMPSAVLTALREVMNYATVFDMVYAPVETELLKAAREGSLNTVSGLSLLVAQAAAAFELFFGEAAPREHDAELHRLLTS